MNSAIPQTGSLQPQGSRLAGGRRTSEVAAAVPRGGAPEAPFRFPFAAAPRRSQTRPIPPRGTAAATSEFQCRGSRSGFTLLEMIMVLVIIAILACLSLPSFHSAITENAIRKDSHQLALMVKTAMIQSADQHRAYMIELSPTEIALHPVGDAAADPDSSASTNDTSDTASTSNVPADVVVTTELDPDNHLQVPDPQKDKSWIAMPPTQWVFQPGELCPATPVRIQRGKAWIALNFGALTGNVENETFELP